MKVLERLGFLSFEDATKSSQQCNTINGKMENNPQWMHSEMIRKYYISQREYLFLMLHRVNIYICESTFVHMDIMTYCFEIIKNMIEK